MRPYPHVLFVSLVLSLPVHAAIAKQIQLLHGQLSFVTPEDISEAKSPSAPSDRYSILADLASADRSFSVKVTYARHTLDAANLTDFLQEKVTLYTRLKAKLPHFTWLKHQLVERDGQRWADISFTHDNSSGFHVYTRCLSCFVHGHLLEIWALTHRAAEPTQKAGVDRVIGSVRLAPGA
jgi:hypothetical protein